MENLSLETQLALAVFNNQVDQMSLEQARSMLKQIHQAYQVQKSIYEDLVKHQWGLYKPMGS